MQRFHHSPRTGTPLVAILVSLICSTAALAQSFPTTSGVIDVNVIRRYSYDGDFLPSVTGFGAGESTPAQGAIDGAFGFVQWDGVSTTGSGSSGGVDVTLDRVYDLAAFDLSSFSGHNALGGYTIELSTTGFGSMTTAFSSATGPGGGVTPVTLATPTAAKYIRYTWTSPSSSGYVQLNEFRAYASTADASFVTPDEGYDIVAMQGNGPVTVTDLTPGKWFFLDSVNSVADLNQSTYLRGNGTGDAQFKLDLGDGHLLQAVTLGFNLGGGTWSDGARVEFSRDGTTWGNAINISGATMIADGYSVSIPVDSVYARYLRVTDIDGLGGALSDIQVFALPEPTSMGLIAVGSVLLLKRRRTRAC